MGANPTSCVILRHSSTPLLLVSNLFLLPDLPSSRYPSSCSDLPQRLQQRVSLLWTILVRVTLLLDDIIKVRPMGAILPYLFLHCIASLPNKQTKTTLQGQQICRSDRRRGAICGPGCCVTSNIFLLVAPPQYKQEDCLDNDRRITVTTYYPCWAPHT